MKKSLFALAALGAFANAAQAQSSVTLYGTMDASVNYITNAGLANGVPNTPSASVANNNGQPVAGNVTALTDGAISTSAWGLKGSEDLGGGMRATFNVESDLLINNGDIYSRSNGNSQLFRRAANVGIGGSFGDIYLGVKSNPLADANSTLLPVMGNTVAQVRNVAGYNSGDFLTNGVQYASPNFSGFNFRLAYAMSNTVDDMTGGSIIAANAFYNYGGLDLVAAYNKSNSVNSNSAAAGTNYCQSQPANNYSATTGNAANVASGAACYNASSAVYETNTSTPGDLTGYLAGIKYKFGNFQVGYGYGHADYNSGNSDAKTASTYNSSTNMLGVGYQATPSLLLGANYIITNLDSSLYNLQARYNLSKRTTMYAQVTSAKNGAGSYQSNPASASSGAALNTKAFGNFVAVNQASSQSPVGIGGLQALPNTTTTAFGVGVIHKF